MTKRPSPRVGVVIPAWNEASRLGPVASAVLAYDGLELCVVDDGSTDETARVATEAGAIVITHDANRGKGVAIRTGIQWLLDRGFEAGVFLDGDGQHLADELPLFVECWEQTGSDLVVGNRMAGRAKMPLYRRVANQMSSKLVSRAAGCRISDSQCGYRLLSAGLMRRLLGHEDARFEFESGMIIDAVRSGFSYAEVPVSCVYLGHASRFRPLADSGRVIGLLWRWRR